MIRTVLIFVYITLVLLVSGLARAADFAQVDEVTFDQKTSMLHVSGEFTNSCQHSPAPVVVSITDDQNAKVVLLGVQVKQPVDQMCLQVLSGRYDLLFDIRALNLPVQTDLVLKFVNKAEGISLDTINTRIDRPAHGQQISATSLSGQLVEVPTFGFNSEPMFVVIGLNGVATEVHTLIDLSDYLNKDVHVGGFSLSNMVAPGVENTDLEYKNSTGQKLEKVFATEISLTPLQ
jgi:hypothetical protein